MDARAHYSAYMVRRVDGLRIITINTDMCKFRCAQGAMNSNQKTVCRVWVRAYPRWRAMVAQRLDSANYFNYINMTSHDPSGMLRFVTDELQDAEDAGDRGVYHTFLRSPFFC